MTSLKAAKAGGPEHPKQDGQEGAGAPLSSGVTLGPNDRLIGELYVEGDVRVNGTLEGQVEATGDVNVAEAATVKASVSGRQVSISGQVNGAVTASKKLVVESSGSLVGDVRVPRLVIQDGASFSGKVSMGPAAEAAPKREAAPKPESVVAPKPEPVVDGAVAAIEVEKPKPKRR